MFSVHTYLQLKSVKITAENLLFQYQNCIVRQSILKHCRSYFFDERERERVNYQQDALKVTLSSQ